VNRWEYLLTPESQARYALAAYYVRDCPIVVEVGAWKNCIADYLKPNHLVIVIDPLAECSPKQGQEVEVIKESLQDVDLTFDLTSLRGNDYGLVFLGFELVGEKSFIAMEKFINMANDAKIVVLEYALKHAPSVEQVGEFLRRCGKREFFRIKLDISGNAMSLPSDSYPPFCERMFIVLKEDR